MKLCPHCQTEKPDDDFYADSRYHGRLSSYCRECAKNYNRERYRANAVSNAARNSQRAEWAMHMFALMRKDKPCVDCDAVFDPIATVYINRKTGKTLRASRVRGWSGKRIRLEASRCDVVCLNCEAQRQGETTPSAIDVEAAAEGFEPLQT